MIEVQKIPGKGSGLVATESIQKGTLLEVAPVREIPSEQLPILKETKLFEYYFVQPIEFGKTQNINGYFVFGLASLCNHEDEPNAHVDWIENEVGLWSHLVTDKDIQAGEEVTLFYTNIDEYSAAESFT